MNRTVYFPDYYRVFERVAGGWLMKPCQFFYRHTLPKTHDDDLELLYGISPQQVSIELFRINGGKPGYYLADLRSNKKYFYCGSHPEDVKQYALRLGIGRVDPMEK